MSKKNNDTERDIIKSVQKSNIFFTKSISDKTRIYQGDIFKNVDYLEKIVNKPDSDEMELSYFVFPNIVVLTQSCDLYNNANKNLLSVLVAPMYNFDDFKMGGHIGTITAIDPPTSDETLQIVKNKIYRYTFFKLNPELKINDCIIDFKHYFSLNLNYLLKIKNNGDYISTLQSPYREFITQRFSNYLSRIGLPEKKEEKND